MLFNFKILAVLFPRGNNIDIDDRVLVFLLLSCFLMLKFKHVQRNKRREKSLRNLRYAETTCSPARITVVIFQTLTKNCRKNDC